MLKGTQPRDGRGGAQSTRSDHQTPVPYNHTASQQVLGLLQVACTFHSFKHWDPLPSLLNCLSSPRHSVKFKYALLSFLLNVPPPQNPLVLVETVSFPPSWPEFFKKFATLFSLFFLPSTPSLHGNYQEASDLTMIPKCLVGIFFQLFDLVSQPLLHS